MKARLQRTGLDIAAPESNALFFLLLLPSFFLFFFVFFVFFFFFKKSFYEVDVLRLVLFQLVGKGYSLKAVRLLLQREPPIG